MSGQLTVQLLPGLLAKLPEDQRIEVLHFGPAQPETVAFFGSYRCRLHFVDWTEALPLTADPAQEPGLTERLQALLALPQAGRLDLVLFWDFLNYLPAEGMAQLSRLLAPLLCEHTAAHAFGVHKSNAPQRCESFAIAGPDSLRLRAQASPLPGYQPLPHSRWRELLAPLVPGRSVLMGDGRLEVSLAAPAQSRAVSVR